MGVLSSASFDDFFNDLERDFSIAAIKPLRLGWHSELVKKRAIGPSKFARMPSPLSFFVTLPKLFITPPPQVHVIGTPAESRFVGVKPAQPALAEQVAKIALRFASVANDDRIYKDYSHVDIDPGFDPLRPKTQKPVAEKPAASTAQEPRKTLSLKSAPQAERLELQPEKRGTLSLKSKPAIAEKVKVTATAKKLSLNSSSGDLAALFKAELNYITQKPEAMDAPRTQDVVVEKRTGVKALTGMDLATAFRDEMQKMLETQDKPVASAPATGKKPSLAA